MDNKVPNFRSSIMGFNKMEVIDFLSRTESEMEIYENRQAAADKTIASMRSEIQNLTRRMEVLTEENCQLETSNAKLRQTAYDHDDTKVAADVYQKALGEIQELKAKLAGLEQKAKAEPEAQQQLTLENEELKQKVAQLTEKLKSTETLQKECDALRADANATEKERKAIHDALISAQRMGEIVLSEARDEAERVTTQARQEAETLTSQAQQSASQTLAEAQKRNADLQASYDRMLMDTSKMKSELIELYRRHLALLAEIPGTGEIPVLEEEILETVGE